MTEKRDMKWALELAIDALEYSSNHLDDEYQEAADMISEQKNKIIVCVENE